MRSTITLLCFLLMCCNTQAQVGFDTMDSLDVNNINASVLVHGNMWCAKDSVLFGRTFYKPKSTFPKDSLTNIGFAAGVWLSAYDNSGRLHVSAKTYGVDSNDYWPGPLDASGRLSYATSADWAYIWKVTRDSINWFRSISVHTSVNTPRSILCWPGAGNIYAKGAGGVSITVPTWRDMAPFKDLNSNGIYEPLLGEYPDVKGDMALWWIFSDNGPTHNQTFGLPLGLEVHAMAYAYKRATLIDNVIYYNYKVVNRSGYDYSNLRLAQMNDVDLGYYGDDYLGFDSTRRIAIAYNNGPDGISVGGGRTCFNSKTPVIGLTFVHLPADVPGRYVPAGLFNRFINDIWHYGITERDSIVNTYMRGPAYGSTITGKGRCSMQDTNYSVRYIYPGDPSDTSGWSECNCSLPFGDRRYILSSNDNYLATGQTLDFTLALVTTNCSDSNYCPYVNFRGIKEVADTAWAVYEHPLWETGVEEPAAPHPHATLYPNPAHNTLTLKVDQPYIGEVCIRDIPGKAVRTLFISTPKTTIDISDLAPGTYVLTTNLKEQPSILFTKQ